MLLGGVVIFVLGFAFGAVALAAVASWASRAYLSTAQVMFRNAEEQHASEAWRAGDFEAATGYTFCALEAEHGVGAAQAFRPEALLWDLFGYALAQKIIIEPNQQTIKKAQPASEAGARAKLAVAWERLGRVDAANREYAKVVALTGNKNVAMWRSLGLDTVDMWSKVQEKQAAPSVPSNSGGSQPSR
jgi:hypothetical protein